MNEFGRILFAHLLVGKPGVSLGKQLPWNAVRPLRAGNKAVRTILWRNVSQIDEELDPANPVHIEMIELCRG